MKLEACSINMQGFSLIEMMMAISIIAFGLFAASQLLYVAAGSNALARAKSAAAVAANNNLESLGALYRQNPLAADLALGHHGPRSYEVVNPAQATVLNRFAVEWVVENVPDPRAGTTLNAKRVSASVTPVTSDGTANSHPGLNKILNVTTIFSQEMQ
jgi:prepilin-type N-terminal cleavage/methylation domain-containing protein